MPARPMHVLLVEDDDAHAMLLSMEIQSGKQVMSLDRVRDGDQALMYVKRQPPYENSQLPDLIVLDLRLPRMDGHQVLKELKADRRLRLIPVVVLTSSDAEMDRRRAYEFHANSYLVKPLDFEKFSQMVQDFVNYWSQWNVSVSSHAVA